MRGVVVACLFLIVGVVSPVHAQDQGEITFWNSVRQSNNPAELKAYLDAYPQGKYAPLAKLRLTELGAAPPGKVDAPSALPAGWQVFRSAEGEFSVALPASPNVKKGADDNQFLVSLGQSAYLIIYTDEPKLQGLDPAEVFDAAQKKALHTANATLIATAPKALDGKPGREIHFRMQNGTAGRVRFFLAGTRFYEVMFAGPTGDENKPEVSAFLDSFQLTTAPAPQPAATASGSVPAEAAAAGSTWRQFRPDDGGFSVMLPGEPKEIVNNKNGKRVKRQFMLTIGDSAAYLVAVDDYDTGELSDTDPKALFDTLQGAVLKQMQFKLRSQRDISLGDDSGREVEFDTKDGQRGIIRLYRHGDRLYQLWCAGVEPVDAEKFFGSFQVTGTASAQPATDEPLWKKFSSAEGKFSVRLPAEPKMTKKSETETQFAIDLGNSVYLISYTEEPKLKGVDPTYVLNAAQQNLLKGTKGSLTKTQPETLNGNPGREVDFTTPDGNAGRIRIYFTGTRLYQVWFLGPAGDEAEPEVGQYFDSFQFLAGASPQNGATGPHADAVAAPSGGMQTDSAPPVGQYGCSSGPAVLAGSGGYGAMLHQLGQWQGDIWILDDHRYAGPYHQDDVGTYRMTGDKLVALTGAYSPTRNKTEIVYAPAAGDHKAALHIAFLGEDGRPQIGLWCVAK